MPALTVNGARTSRRVRHATDSSPTAKEKREELSLGAAVGDDHGVGLLTATSGVRLRDADSREATTRYLERNPGLSFVALVDGAVVGCVMCGHDGRRGYLQHLAVSPRHRLQGIGSALVEACLTELETLGIVKTHIDVLIENQQAHDFWRRHGWHKRDDIFRYSFLKSHGTNA